jgi:hypothetical protein
MSYRMAISSNINEPNLICSGNKFLKCFFMQLIAKSFNLNSDERQFIFLIVFLHGNGSMLLILGLS